MANKYLSFQGKIHIALITNGVAGALHEVGNMPDFQISISADQVEHHESQSGQRAKDFVLIKTTGVAFDGTLEEGTVQNLEYMLSAKSKDTGIENISNVSLGTVNANDLIRLGKYNLSNFVLVDSSANPVTVDPSKYDLDADFGTVKVKDVSGLVMPLKYSAKSSAVTKIGLATDFTKEYLIFFKGINTADNSKVALTLWRTKKSPDMDFPMIHEELGKYKIKGEALADITQVIDADLGQYGEFVVL